MTLLLLRTRPPAGRDGVSPRWPKLLISCRTHYFRTLRDQQNHFTGQQRGATGAADYRALVLLPLTDAQVQRYLAAVPGAALERLLATIASVHNLPELTRRPFTLRLVAEFIPTIERRRAAGVPVQGVTLYRELVQRWLARDAGKHHISPDHKRLLVADLAAHLWRTGNRRLPAEGIERWFHGWLKTDPYLADIYGTVGRDQLHEDLRTATFLVRDDEGTDSGFRFAHTSLLEYFLAEYLLAALRADRPADWGLPTPSPETLDFLGQLLAEAGEPGLLARMTGWGAGRGGASGTGAVGGATGADGLRCAAPILRGSGTGAVGGATAADGLRCAQPILRYALRAVERGWPVPSLRGGGVGGATAADGLRCAQPILRYALRAVERGWPVPSLRGLVLVGADLSGLVIAGSDSGPLLDLVDADLSGCRLNQARLARVDLTNARFVGALLTQAEVLDCIASGSDWSDARCDGAVWRHTRLTAARWVAATGRRGLFLHCEGAPRAISGLSAHLVLASDAGADRIAAAGPRLPLRWLGGHSSAVIACAFSPDGTRLLSASGDGTLGLWDAASGQRLLTCRGHEGSVTACAFSPDGTRLLSASGDGTLGLWDAASGQRLLTCRGHYDPVTACAFSPDGSRLLSASADHTLGL